MLKNKIGIYIGNVSNALVFGLISIQISSQSWYQIYLVLFKW